MKLFLLRHAEAAYGPPDPERQLTEAGHRMARDLAAFIADKPALHADSIWVSPYARAQQTAAPIIRQLSAVVTIVPELVPEADPHALLRRLKSQEGSLLLVGHNPLLSILACHLTGLHGPFSFKKGALLCLKGDPRSQEAYQLTAYLPPAALGLK